MGRRQALAEKERKAEEKRAIEAAKRLKAEKEAEKRRLMAEAIVKDEEKLKAKMTEMCVGAMLL